MPTASKSTPSPIPHTHVGFTNLPLSSANDTGNCLPQQPRPPHPDQCVWVQATREGEQGMVWPMRGLSVSLCVQVWVQGSGRAGPQPEEQGREAEVPPAARGWVQKHKLRARRVPQS